MKKVFFSLDAEDSRLFLGYFDGSSHFGGWPVALLPKSSVELMIDENKELLSQFETGIDIMEWDGENLKITIPDYPDDPTWIIEPSRITLDAETRHSVTVYEIGRYCWHIDEIDDVIKNIAVEFSRVLRSWHTEEQMNEINRLNAELGEDSGICNSHNFFDANEAMIEGFEKIMGCSLFPYLEDETIEELYNDHLADLYAK
jgi:hypothetical protein